MELQNYCESERLTEHHLALYLFEVINFVEGSEVCSDPSINVFIVLNLIQHSDRSIYLTSQVRKCLKLF